jgi:signal transduction histidine kinase
MTEVAGFPVPLESVFAAMPVGVAYVDRHRRIMMMNAAFRDSLGLPADAFPPGTPVEDAVRATAHRGVYGPGDPESQVQAVMAPDRSRPGRLRRRVFQGRSFDLYNSPLPDGSYVVTAIETTGLLAARASAEQAVAQTATAIQTLRVGLAAFRPDGTLLFFNPRFTELLAVPSDRIAAGTSPGTSLPDLLALMADSDEYAGADGQAFLAEQRSANRGVPFAVRRLRGDGTVIDVVSDPLPEGGWTIMVSDISRLVRAESEAQRRARLLDSILAAVPHGICVYGADRRVALFNQAYTQVMAGAPLAVGDHLIDVIRKRAAVGEYGPGEAEAIYAQQMAFDISRPQMRRRRRPDGTTIDVRTAPLPDGGHISVVTDITALVNAEAEIARRAEELSVMLANIQHGILLWGPDKRLRASNAAAADLLGHPPGLLTAGRSEAEVHENMVQRGEWGGGAQAHAIAQALRERDRSVPYSRQMTTRAGRVLQMRSAPIPDGGWVSTFTDISEEHAAEETLRRAKEAAEAANQAKSRFLATMSHELRTPLNVVIGFSDALLREAGQADPGRTTEFAQQINAAGRQLLGLINIILDVARIESGRFDLASEWVDIARVVRTAIRQADPAAQAAEITVTAEVAPKLPPLRSDERRLVQALGQLLSNAIKFTDAGGSVTVSAERDATGDLLLRVRDTGIGIPAADLERVFEPFTQLDSTLSRRYQGAGLGLYIARALIAGHGGTLVLHSRPSEGTTAEIRLPASRLGR